MLALTLLALLITGVLVSAVTGQLDISASEVWGSILNRLGFSTTLAPTEDVVDATLWVVRFPRIVMAIAVGASLAVGGALMQAVFGNPLAEPGVVGVSSGAALGASIAIVFGVQFAGGGVAALAFVGGLLATLLVYAVARAGGRTEVVTLLLTGIAINAFAQAGLAFVLFLADTASREQIVFWQLGSLAGSLWSEVVVVVPLLLVGMLAAVVLARQLDVLALGERNARHLGVDVEALRIVVIVLVALLTAAAVAFAGIIAFVGLVVPHIIRMVLGPAHRGLLWASAVGGATLLLWADLLTRTLVQGADLPIGMLTALVGGPFFFALLYQQRRKSGGWM
ncbi:iron complex transport system permease [Pontimonas salivibrio]|uniref:Iron complex transport system permease n=1 Tax=Pontimonas salivibrio TaxID=1159327 RepID=A0A2L2BNH9_9MICO|nr:iron complex transport system permease [Pontimonas salivibrio]